MAENEKSFFCPKCLNQVKCKNCNELLEENSIGCVVCGTPLASGSNDNMRLNQIEFEQKGDTKKFKASFSDNVGQELVATFGGMVGVSVNKGKFISNTKKPSIMGLNLNSNHDEDVVDVEFIEDTELDEALKRVFRIDGESLIVQTSTFKSLNNLDKEKRISLLTLLGYKYLHKSEEIKRSTLTEILKNFKLNSGGFRNWIGKSEEIGQKSGGLIFLTPNGLSTAIEVLKEVINPAIEKGSVKISKQKSSRRKPSDNSSEPKKSSKGPKEYLLTLIQEGYFKNHRSLSDIVSNIKDTKAITFKTTDISGHMGKLVSNKTLKREKGESGNYEYFV